MKKYCKNLGNLLFLSFLIAILGCYEPLDGCLDVDALNYDVSADNACNSCCNLPEISLTFAFLFQGEAFIANDTLMLENGTQLKIENFAIHLSEIRFEGDDGSFITQEDSLRIFTDDDREVFVRDNFRYLARTRFAMDLEGFRYIGGIKSIGFDLGIPEVVSNYDLDSVRINSDYGTIPTGAFSESDGFITYSLSLDFIGDESRTLTSYVQGQSGSINLVEVEMKRAENLEVDLSLDFSNALNGLTSSQSDSEMIAIINGQIADSFFQRK